MQCFETELKDILKVRTIQADTRAAYSMFMLPLICLVHAVCSYCVCGLLLGCIIQAMLRVGCKRATTCSVGYGWLSCCYLVIQHTSTSSCKRYKLTM